ncbi:unnamed protein product [Soboliphyme baturini]|uniref:Guanine nucleotide-binding protein subunit gamma n=1 Tax=Soboliphyme baturini TaxID=241478 RepID=A0A183IXJ4_9BILA|nr:unnamed protein product [Soboliphyme baturini]
MLSREKADFQHIRLLTEQLRRELHVKRIPVSQASNDLVKYVSDHQRQDVLVCGFSSPSENPFRQKSSFSCSMI